MCSTRGATVRDVAARDYVASLACHLKEAHVIRTPNKMKANSALRDQYFQEAAEMLRLYYLHPSVPIPVRLKKPRNQQEQAKGLLLAIRKACFGELIRSEWLRQDERCNIVLVTERACEEMDRIAAAMKAQPRETAVPPPAAPEEIEHE